MFRTRVNVRGFTIIEVMIVLIIAAVILLIVFLAVPALQRNSRNTQRRADAGRAQVAWDQYLPRNNNIIPTTTAAMQAAASNIYTEAQPQMYDEVHFTTTTGAVNPGETTTKRLIFRVQSVCNTAGTNVDGATSPGRVVLVYFIETASGWQSTCQQLR